MGILFNTEEETNASIRKICMTSQAKLGLFATTGNKKVGLN